jgi:hypothetical protein
MTHRIRLAMIVLAFAATATSAELEYAAKRERLNLPQAGALRFSESEVRWTPAHGRGFALAYGELQRLVMEPRAIEITGYADRAWRLGADAHWRFRLNQDAGAELYALLRAKLDSRFAPRWAEPPGAVLWSVPAKLASGRFPAGNWGAEGVLEVGSGRIVFRSDRAGMARTWLDREIDNVRFEAPFRLVLEVREGGVSVERELTLKRELDPRLYDALWRRLNRPRGLELLNGSEK